MLATRGYVVVAPTFPLSNANAPGGGPKLDYQNQPGDVSFVIDQMLAMNRAEGALHGLIAPQQIGAMGHALGAVTTFGAVYNRAGRDPRIKAAVPIAGIQLPFAGGRWTWPATPLLVIHGDRDETGPYVGSVRAFGKAKPPKFLLRLIGAPHLPFAAPWLEPLVRTTDNFFDRYLRGAKAARKRMQRSGNVPTVSTLQSDPG
jgi:predicted dienelactone hydrolase